MAAIPTFVLPLHFLAILATGWLVSMGLLWFIMDLRHYGKEGFDFRKCRKNNIPYFLDVDIGSGAAIGYAAEKTKKGSGRIFHKSEAGAKIDPSISMGNDEPIRLPRGLEIQLHGTLDGWPTSLRNAAGIAKIKEIRQKSQYNPISSIPDKELIEILDTPDDHLTHDVRLFIERYKIPNPDADPEQVRAVNAKLDTILKTPAHRVINWLRRDDLATMLLAEETEVQPLLELMIMKYWKGVSQEIPPEFPIAVQEKLTELRQDPIISTIVSPIIPPERMLELINELKTEAIHTLIDPKFGAFRSALKDNPNAFKTTDITTLENILRQMFVEDFLNKINWMQWGAIIIGIIVAGGVTTAIVVSVIK